jgi:hypothetical protein
VLLILILSPTLCVGGSVTFVEVEANPEGVDKGREWVRIKNDSGSTVNLTQLKFVENGARHAIRAVKEEGVPHGAYAVIADNAELYADEHPKSSDYLFDSAFSLNNSGETIRLEDSSRQVVAEITYSGVERSSAKSATRVIAAAPAAYAADVDEESVLPWIFAVACVAAVGALALPRVTPRPSRGYTIIDIS